MYLPLTLTTSIKGDSLTNMSGKSLSRVCSIEGCTNKHWGLGWCAKHYQRFKKYGNPLTNILNTTPENFWPRISKDGPIMPHMTTPCWEWQGYCHAKYGYGQVSFENKLWHTHRLAYFFTTGIRPTLFVLHECDNRKCCNPAHLREGTNDDNIADMIKRGRKPRGEDTPNATITENQVRRLKSLVADGARLIDAAKECEVKYYIALQINRGHSWKHVLV